MTRTGTEGVRIAPFITGDADVLCRERAPAEEVFDHGAIRLETAPIHT